VEKKTAATASGAGGDDDKELEWSEGDIRDMDSTGWYEDDDGYWHHREDDAIQRKPSALDLVLAGLPTAFSREAVDAIAEKFCYHNSKTNRQKYASRHIIESPLLVCSYLYRTTVYRLVQVVFRVHRNKQDLLPYYSRLIATLSSCLKDIGSEVVSLLISEFWGLLKRGGQFRIESRQRNVRYLAELTKFKVCPPNGNVLMMRMMTITIDWHY
jgi:regulator of nonsense transcripts 2